MTHSGILLTPPGLLVRAHLLRVYSLDTAEILQVYSGDTLGLLLTIWGHSGVAPVLQLVTPFNAPELLGVYSSNPPELLGGDTQEDAGKTAGPTPGILRLFSHSQHAPGLLPPSSFLPTRGWGREAPAMQQRLTRGLRDRYSADTAQAQSDRGPRRPLEPRAAPASLWADTELTQRPLTAYSEVTQSLFRSYRGAGVGANQWGAIL